MKLLDEVPSVRTECGRAVGGVAAPSHQARGCG